MDLGSMGFLKALLVAVYALHPYFSHAETAPNYSFVHESTTAPPVSYHDYIVVGGGAAGCPLAATLSETANVLVLERGGSPYRNPGKTDKGNFLLTLLDPSPDSYAQIFITEDGVYNHRARVLGGGTVINAGFYSHAETEFVKESGLDEALVNDAYQWVENKVVFKAPLLQWQTAMRDGLLEAGVLPYNGFTNEHINGTKIGSTIFDMNDRRHSAADLLEYADPKNITVYLHATVTKILFTTQTVGSRPRATGVIYEDALGVKHTAYLTNDSKSEIIVSAGVIGSSQLLMLSGIGPRSQLEPLGIKLVMDQPMVGQGLADNTLNGLLIPSPNPVELSLLSTVGISLLLNYIEAGSGLNLAPSFGWISKFLLSILDQTAIGSFFDTRLNGGIIIQKVARPLSTGHLELRSTDPHETPKVRFNYFQEPEDLRNCVQGMKTIINVVNSKAFSKFRYRTISTQQLLTVVAALPLNQRPRHFDTASSLEQFCNDTVMTFWHHHGGCQVGKVVDKDYRVIGVDGLRVIDASTFSFTPGTNPQATVMMLGRAMGVRIEKDRRS
ncbi:protein HOTHEAD-like isoform X1 [Gossypium australe]|uniref:Protein HOTHEAD-like isoform X1 n=1 Tax=Gossypium australe TaxID=47621 RepID=A0A5B6UNY4_9ROSI|nr:protein HOTHEAD-like isoform X1 [Gossypium australe]